MANNPVISKLFYITALLNCTKDLHLKGFSKHSHTYCHKKKTNKQTNYFAKTFLNPLKNTFWVHGPYFENL